jgi:hypothetical protein
MVANFNYRLGASIYNDADGRSLQLRPNISSVFNAIFSSLLRKSFKKTIAIPNLSNEYSY